MGRYLSCAVATSMVVEKRNDKPFEKEELNKLLTLFKTSKIVITDRLHGMILSAITNTPCIAINNSNGKVAGVYEKWLKGKSSIILTEPEKINKEIIQNTISLNKKFYPIKANFEKIIEIVANEHA